MPGMAEGFFSFGTDLVILRANITGGRQVQGRMRVETITLKRWQEWQADGYTSLPYMHAVPLVPGEDRPRRWSAAWQAASPYAVVLESGKDGRYSYLGLQPAAVIRGKGDAAEVDLPGAAGGRPAMPQVLRGKPIEVVRERLASRCAPRVEGAPKWTGGLAGFWSYDVIRSIERLPALAADDLGLPDYLFLQLDELWIVDHAELRLICAVHTAVDPSADGTALAGLHEAAAARAQDMAALWRRLTAGAGCGEAAAQAEAHGAGTEGAAAGDERLRLLESDRLQIDIEAMAGITSPTTKEAYMASVRRIQAYIAAGDVFQVNLSQRQTRPADLPAEELYEWLRLVNPSPYMGLLRCPDFQLVSGSPELLVELRGGRLATRPIAGTRRRGRTPEEDAQLAEELRSNEKERAEHIMLVDLERNDLGRIARFGSVRVDELMTIEYYSHVMHLVSQVEAELAPGRDALDVIAAAFPGGTITGAPKIRTMEIIEELEPTRRGPYTGSLGWIDYNGDMEFNILIRTMTVKDGRVHIQAGAGIVIDSDPEREYYESLNKAKALWKAVQYAERFAAETAVSRDTGRS